MCTYDGHNHAFINLGIEPLFSLQIFTFRVIADKHNIMLHMNDVPSKGTSLRRLDAPLLHVWCIVVTFVTQQLEPYCQFCRNKKPTYHLIHTNDCITYTLLVHDTTQWWLYSFTIDLLPRRYFYTCFVHLLYTKTHWHKRFHRGKQPGHAHTLVSFPAYFSAGV